MKVSEPLTKDQVSNLPAGSEIEVTWSGGNGPHVYRVWVDTDGTRCVDNIYRDPITFIGSEPPFTVVREVGESS